MPPYGSVGDCAWEWELGSRDLPRVRGGLGFVLELVFFVFGSLLYK